MVRPTNLQNVEYTGFRAKIASIVEHPKFSAIIAALIILNAVAIGMETSHGVMDKYGTALHAFDEFVLFVFIIELVMKLFLYGGSFFRAPWNVFDFIIICIALIPTSGPLTVLRTLRIFRALRLMSLVPQMRRVIAALLHAIPGMGSIVAVLFLIFYVAAVLATQFFGQHSDPHMQELFGTIGASMYTLFQVMTLEGWAENVANPTISHFPWAWVYFIPFIIVTSFAVLNLFIGIIVDAMSLIHEEEAKEEKKDIKHIAHEETLAVKREINKLRADISDIRALLEKLGKSK